MKKYFLLLEDLLVAVTFAEAGVYDSPETYACEARPANRESACLRAS